jgi:hypothetical protein
MDAKRGAVRRQRPPLELRVVGGLFVIRSAVEDDAIEEVDEVSGEIVPEWALDETVEE